MPLTSASPKPIIARDRSYWAVVGLSVLFFALTTWTSYVRWADFAYRTFDLAYYVQALWQLVHGRFEVSVQYVPLLGNHVEPIVLLIAPIFFFIRQPMLFVVLQNAALATMGPVSFRSAVRLGLTSTQALLLSAALLITPATGYVALHEFHPEALSAPFLLLMLHARVTGSLRQHWLWFAATLACKENMALLLVAYCLVQCLAERKKGRRYLCQWYLAPMAVALVWFVLCATVITPALNSGNIDYGALYDRLGSSGGEILRNALTRPQLFVSAFYHAATNGNLVWALFLPFLCLPLLRPKWILIATPIFLQHLLSWRSSEWTVYFHYAAPLLPLLWFATAEAVAVLGNYRRFIPLLILLACIAGQIIVGPARAMAESTSAWWRGKDERARKTALLARIPARASVVAPLPYLSHLATREELHSLHYILKGLRTLSRQSFSMPKPTDYVLIDYADSATFDREAGYYHPAMRTVDGRIIASSDTLLHEFLKQQSWDSHSWDELTLLQRRDAPAEIASPDFAQPIWQVENQAKLLSITKSAETLSSTGILEITINWELKEPREVLPWLELRFTSGPDSAPITLVRGLSAPEAAKGAYQDRWHIRAEQLPPGNYQVTAIFLDNAKRVPLGEPVSLGTLTITP